MILNDEGRANDRKVHSEDALTAQKGKLKQQNKRGHNAIIVKRKGILPKIAHVRRRMNPVRPVKQEMGFMGGCSMCRRRIFNS